MTTPPTHEMSPSIESKSPSPPGAADELDALLHATTISPLDETGWIRVTGPDRVRWLNGMVTNSIQDLAPGQGCYNFVLNAQGRIQGDLTAFALDDAILLETATDQVETLLPLLDRFIIMDDVELQDWSANRTGLLVAGPDAEALLRAAGFAGPLDNIKAAANRTIENLQWGYFDWKPRPNPWPVEFIRAYSPLVPRYEIWSTPAILEEIRRSLASAGATLISPTTLEHLRLLEGTPRYGADIRNTESARDLPQETAPIGVQHRALHFTKGCYLGQEIVERIHSRGSVHRAFTGLRIIGALPAPGTPLTSAYDSNPAPRPVGEITSAALIPLSTGPIQLALGYLRREALANPQPLVYPGGTAIPITLPYSPG